MRSDDGYFPRGSSMLRRVQGERAVGLLYGQRGLLIGALDPRNFVGTLSHSRYRDATFKRLAATGKMFETVFFGSTAEADRVLAAVGRMHDRVEGTLPEDAGRAYPAGTPYSAFDPELMLWTIAVAADSARYFYELLVRSMGEEERDAFWADWVRFGELFGMPSSVAPRGWDEFREYFDGRLGSEDLHLTPAARISGFGVAFKIPFGARGFLARDVHNLIMLGSLPGSVRRRYGLAWNPGQELAFRAASSAIRLSRPLSPRRIARGRNTIHFDAVAREERRLTAAGRPPIELPA